MLIQNYSEHWKTDFKTLKKILHENISNLRISIEHIGSTAVPNLDAKAIIDIDIIFYNGDDFEKIKSQLAKIGYFHNGNQGIVDREVFKRNKNNFHPVLDSIPHHLYVCPSHSLELQKHLLFRDFLCKNELARKEYQNLKYEIAREANQDKKIYAQMKEIKAKNFISKIIKLSNETC